MGINGGRNLRGIEGDPSEEGLYLRVNIKDQDRPRSWVIQKAVDEWLKNRGY